VLRQRGALLPPAPPSAAHQRARRLRLQGNEASKHKVAAADGAGSSGPSGPDDEQKYARRIHPLRRTLQRLLPSLFPPSLPVTMK
jgi:hypothetical protein